MIYSVACSQSVCIQIAVVWPFAKIKAATDIEWNSYFSELGHQDVCQR